MRLTGTVLILVSAVLATGCVAAQGLLARWWKTDAGRHTFVFQAVFALCLDLWALRVVVPDGAWFLIARLVAFMGVPVVLAWRLEVIIRTWQRGRRARAESKEDASP
ncbi:putative phage holin [Microbispora sp. ATCC PTA-5024]|uniref:putative phage holin n=1 Tax=Microbispora sp. ATCC PTA-5024 TaxID=316330 RepID=UPI00056C8F7E|nr:hypothetical protein [Microbispora sp. ATCC PTA-5024]